MDSRHSSFNTTNIIQELVNGVQTALNPTDNDVEETTQLIHQANIAAAATDQSTDNPYATNSSNDAEYADPTDDHCTTSIALIPQQWHE